MNNVRTWQVHSHLSQQGSRPSELSHLDQNSAAPNYAFGAVSVFMRAGTEDRTGGSCHWT